MDKRICNIGYSLCAIIRFNNVGFCYFIISLINAKAAVEKLPVYLLSLLLGSIFLNLGCSGLLALYKKAMMKKAAAKSRGEK